MLVARKPPHSTTLVHLTSRTRQIESENWIYFVTKCAEKVEKRFQRSCEQDQAQNMKSLFIILLFATCFILSQAFEVFVTSLTTTSISLQWNEGHNVSVSYVKLKKNEFTPEALPPTAPLYDMTNSTTRIESSFISSPLNNIILSGLEEGSSYQLLVESGDEMWGSKVMTATCPPGWSGFESACYRLHHTPTSWNEAADVCSQFSSHLAQPRSMDQVDYIQNLLIEMEKNSSFPLFYWVGVHVKEGEDEYTYIDMSRVSNTTDNFWRRCSATQKLGKGTNCIGLLTLPPESLSPCSLTACINTYGFACKYQVSQSPRIVTVNTESRSATLSWEAPLSVFGSKFIFYQISVTALDDGNQTNTNVSFDQTSLVLHHLIPGQHYAVLINTIDEIGDGLVEGGVFPRSEFVTHPLTPFNLSVKQVTPTSALVSWEFPNDNNQESIHHGFYVYYSPLRPETNSSIDFENTGRVEVNASVNQIRLNNLEPRMLFEIFVTSFVGYHVFPGGNETKESSASDSVKFETLVSPPLSFAVINITTDEIFLQWGKALGDVDQYEVTRNQDDQNPKISTYSSGVRNAVESDLTPGESYNISIVSVQRRDVSDALHVNQRTQPLPVERRLVNIDYTSNSVKIIINPDSNDNSVFDGYNITLTSLNNKDRIFWRIMKNNSASYDFADISGLTPGRTYNTTIWKTSGSVLSSPTFLDLFNTKLDPPKNLDFKSRDERKLRLQWDPAPGDFLKYVVRCSGEADYKCYPPYTEVDPDETELLVDNLNPGVLYTFNIVAQGKLQQSEPASFSVRTLPDPPTDVQLGIRNTTSIGLRWRAAGYVQDKYKIEFKSKNDGIVFGNKSTDGQLIIPYDNKDPVPQLNQVVTDLAPGTRYDFSIQTGSNDTWSKSATTSAATIPDAVTSLQVEEIGASWVMLSWRQGKGSVDQFQLSIDRKEDLFTPTAALSRYNYTSLMPASTYYPKVVALSGSDESVPTQIEIRTRPVPPSSVGVSDVNETSFRLAWVGSHWDDVIIQYSSANLLSEYERSVQSNSVVIGDLVPGSKYSVIVKSVSTAVESFPVNLEVYTYPFSLENVTVSNVSITNIKLNWSQPVGENGGFFIEREPMHGTLNITDNGATLWNLTPGVTYEISIYTLSVDQTRRSRTSLVISVATDEAEPGSPEELMVKSQTTTSFVAQWSPPSDPNGEILRYTLRYQQVFPDITEPPKFIVSNDSLGSTSVSGLVPGAGYYVSVRAENSAGEGNFTEPQLARLLEDVPGPVKDLDAFAVSSSSLRITWKPPTFSNGIIISYLLTALIEENKEVGRTEFYPFMNETYMGCLFHDVSNHINGSFRSEVWKRIFLTVERENKNSKFQNYTTDDGFNQKAFLQNDEETREIKQVQIDPFCPVNYELNDLKPYTSYNILVEARTSMGFGVPSNFSVVTKQKPPEGPPINIRISSSNARNVTIAWDPPVLPNGLFTYTVILYQELSDLRMDSTNDTSLLITNLQPFSWYAASVFASSEAGEGPSSNLTYFHTKEGVPDEVRNLRLSVNGSRSIIVKWTSPLHSHGVITSYVIEVFDYIRNNLTKYYHKADEMPQLAHTLTIDQIFINSSLNASAPFLTSRLSLGSLIKDPLPVDYDITIDRLTPFTLYNVRVMGATSSGTGMVASDNIKTVEDIPGSAPANITYTNISSTSVNISWLEPLIPNGLITKYVVVITNGGFKKHPTTNQFVVIDNLQKFHRYNIYVWAETAIGEGPSSSKVVLHTDEDLPDSPPLNVQYKNISSRAIELWWEPPLIPNGIITSYTVYYSKDNITLKQKSPKNSTVLDLLQPYGLYEITVSASTRIGEGKLLSDPLLARVLEGQPATPPHNLTYENVTSHEINLSWLPPTSPNGIIQFYNVTLTHQEISSLLATPDQTPYLVISSLKPYSEYTAVVRSNTKYGDGGQESAPLQIWTMQDIPSSPPRQINYVNLTSSSINVSWLPPLKPNGIIQRYTVRYRKLDQEQEEKQADIFGTTHSAIIDGLEQYTRYRVWISASTVAGQGPSSEIHILTDEDVPSSPPYNVIYTQKSSTSLVLSWSPPQKPNGVITSYRVYYSNSSLSLHKDTREPKLTLSNLRKYGKYEAFVTARTRLGYGRERSKEISFETLEDAPSDPPSNLQVTTISSTSLDASWNPPLQPNGKIQFYTLYYKQDNSTAKNLSVIGRTSSIISHLSKYTWYSVWATASTAKGDGNHRSSIVRVKTLEDVPDFPVVNLSANNVSSSSMALSWDPFLPLTGPTYFYLEIASKDNQNEKINFTTNSTKANILKLKPYTIYLVSVFPRVFGTLEENGPEKRISVLTGEDKPESPVIEFELFNLTSTSIALKWKPPAQPNGIITFYTISINSRNKMPQDSVTIPGNLTTAFVDGLLPYTSYSATIISETEIGVGPPATLKFRTFQDIPTDAPSDIQISNVSESAARVKWSPPLIPNGEIINYSLNYKEQSMHGRNINVITPSLNSFRVIEDLFPFTTYILTVAAATRVGTGPASDPAVMFKTLESVPEAPQEIVCNSTHENSITVSWKAPNRPNGLIRNYIISYETYKNKSVVSFNVSANDDSRVIEDLLPYTDYVVTIRGVTMKGAGEEATCFEKTQQGYPESPQNLDVIETKENSIMLSWLPPIHINGKLENYVLRYSPPDGCLMNQRSVSPLSLREENVCDVVVGLDQTFSLENLKTFTSYEVSVKASTRKGSGPPSSSLIQRTSEGIPDYPPRFVNISAITSSSIAVSWTEPEVLAGLTRYRITANNTKETVKSDLLSSSTRSFVMRDLEEDNSYDVTVEAVTSKGFLGSKFIKIHTLEDAPSDSPRNLTITMINKNSSSIKLQFNPPLDPNGNIVSYQVQYRIKKSNETYDVIIPSSDLFLTMKQSYEWPIHNLLGGRIYFFRIRASTKIGFGPWSTWSLSIKTPTTAPPKPMQSPRTLSNSDGVELITSSSLTVSSPCVFSNKNGRITMLGVIIAEEGADLNKNPTNWKVSHSLSPSPPYLVIASNNPQEYCSESPNNLYFRRKRSADTSKTGFVIGTDGSCYDDSDKSFCNGPLKSDTLYRVKYRAETENGLITDTEYSDPIRTQANFLAKSKFIFIGVGAAVVVAIILIVSFVCIRKRRSSLSKSDQFSPALANESEFQPRNPGKGPVVESGTHLNKGFACDPPGSDKVSETRLSRSILKTELGNHISHLSKSQYQGFTSEYNDLCSIPLLAATSSADSSSNKSKNRRVTMVPDDLHRVMLCEIPGEEGSDYINGSYIPGEASDRQYITTQLPMQNTQGDFWRMMWECGSSTIIMLCKVDEKSDIYWPRKEKERYGSLTIHLVDEEKQSEWITRHFYFEKGSRSRNVTQISLKKWPTSKSAVGTKPLLRFFQHIRASVDRVSSPLVVMSRDGSERSGVFISADRIFDQIHSHSHIDLFGVAATLRRYRTTLLPTLNEYILLYHCAYEITAPTMTTNRTPTGDGLEETTF